MKRTPSDEEVLSAFALSDDLQEELPGLAWEQIITKEAFTRWLAEHDREVEARGLEKANAIAERVAEEAEQRRNADPTDAEYWEGFRRGARSVAHSVGARAQQVREGNS